LGILYLTALSPCQPSFFARTRIRKNAALHLSIYKNVYGSHPKKVLDKLFALCFKSAYKFSSSEIQILITILEEGRGNYESIKKGILANYLSSPFALRTTDSSRGAEWRWGLGWR
jgi:hypothetical protein